MTSLHQGAIPPTALGVEAPEEGAHDEDDVATFRMVDGDMIYLPPPPKGWRKIKQRMKDLFQGNHHHGPSSGYHHRRRSSSRNNNNNNEENVPLPFGSTMTLPVLSDFSQESSQPPAATTTRPTIPQEQQRRGNQGEPQEESPAVRNQRSKQRKRKGRRNRRLGKPRESVADEPPPAPTNASGAPPFLAESGQTPDRQANVLPLTVADCVIEEEADNNKASSSEPEEVPASLLVCTDEDIKAEMEDVAGVDSFLLRASLESNSACRNADSETTTQSKPHTKRSDGSVPLSVAKLSDKVVHNDMLKVLLVGAAGTEKSLLARALRGAKKKPPKRSSSAFLSLDAHLWSVSNIQFKIWDVQGLSSPDAAAATTTAEPNLGAHPATQSLFFTNQTLYVLVWDLACHDPHTWLPELQDDDGNESDDDDGIRRNAAQYETAVREANRVLQADIARRVLEWIDRIATCTPQSAIVPVAFIPRDMPDREVERRCEKMKRMLEDHVKLYQGKALPHIVLSETHQLLCVNLHHRDRPRGLGGRPRGLDDLRGILFAIATDPSRSVFSHVGTGVPASVVPVLHCVRRHQDQHKLIRLDHILSELGKKAAVPVDQVVRALHFLASVGEILYFRGGNADDNEEDIILSSFVVLSRQWLVSALSCILRNDLQRELEMTRKFMNMQCLYSEQCFEESEIVQKLVKSNGNVVHCPLLTCKDAEMLWRKNDFMLQAVDHHGQLGEGCSTATVFSFLKGLLVHTGVFIPFKNLTQEGPKHGPTEVFFVPSVLPQVDPGDVWRYRPKNAWTTALCNSWLFQGAAPSDLFERLVVVVLRDLDVHCREFAGFSTEDDAENNKSIPNAAEVHDVKCWKNAMLITVGTKFKDSENQHIVESFVDLFVAIVDQNAPSCVASDDMGAGVQRVIVSGRGQSGLNNLKLHKGGYQTALDSVQSVLEHYNNATRQVVCPKCLANRSPSSAKTWSWDEVAASINNGRDSICGNGHRVNFGTWTNDQLPESVESSPLKKPVPEILKSVVLVGLWNPTRSGIHTVGSGFVASRTHGLIATAAHVLFDMADGDNFGRKYHGIDDARVAIGILPAGDNRRAVWRYFAEVIASDVHHNVDVCVLRIKTKLESDVDDDNPCLLQPGILLDSNRMREEDLTKLETTEKIKLDDSVRVLGYSQRDRVGHGVIRSPDFAKGYVCRVFSKSSDDVPDEESVEERVFEPHTEIVVRCPTIGGHSGGPCVNEEGNVVGIVSRADPTDPQRCYLVTGGQVRNIVKRAREICFNPDQHNLVG